MNITKLNQRIDGVVEGVVELIGGLLDLQLLPVNLVLNVVNPLVELGDVHLSVLKAGLSGLVLALQGVDLLNQLLFPLQSLLSGLLELLHVLTHSLELFLNPLQVLLGQFSSLKTPLQLSLLDSELPAQLVKLLLIVMSHLDGGPQVLVQLLDGDFIVHAGALNNLNSLENIVSRLGGEGELGDGVAEGVGRLLVFFLHQHDPTGEGGDISLNFLELLLSFLKRLGGLGQFVIGLIKTDLKALDFLAIVSDVTVGLISACSSLASGILEALDGGIEPIGLSLEALHLLADGVHICAFFFRLTAS